MGFSLEPVDLHGQQLHRLFLLEVLGSGLVVSGFWFRVRVYGLGFRVSVRTRAQSPYVMVAGFRVRVSGFGFQVSGFGFRGLSFGFRVSGFGFQVSGFGFRVSGFGFRVWGVDRAGCILGR